MIVILVTQFSSFYQARLVSNTIAGGLTFAMVRTLPGLYDQVARVGSL